MSLSFTSLKRIREDFGSIKTTAPMPNLIEVQKKSYDLFLQFGVAPEKRGSFGLQSVLASIFPIKDFAESATLEYVSYGFDSPKYDVDECRQRGVTFCVPLKVKLRLIIWDVDSDPENPDITSIKEQEVYFGDIPLMTNTGTFVINGTERVIVSQMHRSPGVFFDHDRGKNHSSGKFLYSARVIPYRGSWLDFEFDTKDLLYFRIDRRRKLLVTTFLRGLGFDKQDILDTFYDHLVYEQVKDGWSIPFVFEKIKGAKLIDDLIDAATGNVVLEAGTKVTPRIGKKLIKDGLKNIVVEGEDLSGSFLAKDILDSETGEVLVEAATELTADKVKMIEDLGLKKISVLNIDNVNVGSYIRDSLVADKNTNNSQALIDIYKIMRPGEPPTVEAAAEFLNSLFFNDKRYDLSAVGRVKMNARLGLDIDQSNTILTKEDVIHVIKTIVRLKDGLGEIDDIDHLSNRRVRSVGELLENQFRIGLVRMERTIVERMNSIDVDTVMPHDLINAKLLMAVIKEFFSSSQLSQFMDQTNPLSEITHKRRLSALGPGGLTRERAGFEVRDVHTTHYSRICPIETPEGPNIGLINSLAIYSSINEHGFIEGLYNKVIDSRVTEETVYLSAIEEGKYVIAQANESLTESKEFASNLVNCRKDGEFVKVDPAEIDLMDVSPKQIFSVAASLIPFLENDDANRALMGSNMQRQAVPLLRSDAPFVGSGMEGVVARDSGACIISNQDGIVDQVDARRIVVRSTSDNVDDLAVEIYKLRKYQRSNQDTCITQRPLVRVGDVIKKGDVIADGPSTDIGELALGRNLLVAFMPWNGYNYEDSILISQRIVHEDAFTSIHIEELEVIARDTRLGPEDITRDIPNVNEDALRHLDEVGTVYVGAKVRAGDVLVGKVTPKGESSMTPEEKLLRAIFGEKAADVRDSSLRVPLGMSGTVVEVRVFSRRGVEKDQRALSNERNEIDTITKDRDDELAIVETFIYLRVSDLLKGHKVVSGPKGVQEDIVIDEELLDSHRKSVWWQFAVADEDVNDKIQKLKEQFDKSKKELDDLRSEKIEKLQNGDDLPQGALKVVKVFVAVKSKLQPGDKMAGRHGNKGVISRIMPIEDMPYLDDGTPVDIVLNPLGVPSRMNVGQIFETHLGWASAKLGQQVAQVLDKVQDGLSDIEALKSKVSDVYFNKESKDAIESMNSKQLIELAGNLRRGVPFATPVFDGAKESDVVEMLKKAGVSPTGQETLYDGRTGEKFDRKVTVGYIYMLKLHHLVDDKMHSRSIGPYSLVTQQPLGGKSHFGGQRFGEMECWALQAYGAAYTLQEMLTVKSDDVVGRIKIYESIVKGNQNFECGIPESFNVMIKELRSLCLNIELNEGDDDEDEMKKIA